MKNLIILLLISSIAFAQKTQTFKFTKLQKKGKLVVVNREVKTISEGNQSFIKLEDKDGEGLVWLPIKNFENGEIAIWMRGKDVLQKSFIGVAFHGLDNKTYDAVYCRPFNFFAKDSVRKIHAIQYISHPNFPWKKLREEQNGIFEKEIVNPPDPNKWFKMRLVIRGKIVEGYINDADKPSLTVKKLNDRQDGKIGLFMGDGAGGDFEKIEVKFQK